MYSQYEIIELVKKIKIPVGWKWDDDGIYINTSEPEAPYWQRVSATPILIVKQMINIKSGKVKYELAYRVNGKWYVTMQNPDFFMGNKVVGLAHLGVNISSNNAVVIVKYLEAIHKVNEHDMQRAYLSDCCGWQNDSSFIPGCDNGIKLDIDDECRLVADGYRTSGKLIAWIKHMSELRHNHRFRFMLAASAAVPLLRLLNQRSFFLYNWGPSKGGKTAALKAALSIWGQPEEIMGSFNTTQVGLEYMAALFNDLPLGLDERQLAGMRQQEKIENIIYMIASGKGRWRGKKDGGVQKIQLWRTIVLATGEEPIGTNTSQTGITTRIIELYGAPYDDESLAARTHQFLETNYGFPGEFLAKYYVSEEKEILRAYYDSILDELTECDAGGAHTTSVTVIALADAILESAFFSGAICVPEELEICQEAIDSAIKMAKTVLEEEKTHSMNDVNANAVQYVMDWILSNKNAFNDNNTGTHYGYEEGGIYYILPSCLDEALRRAGYSPRKTRVYMMEHELIAKEENYNGAMTSTVLKRRNGTRARYVEFRGLKGGTS